MKTIPEHSSLIKDLITQRFVSIDGEHESRNLVDVLNSNPAPISPDLALDQVRSSVMFKGLADKEALAKSFREVQTKDLFQRCRGLQYKPQAIEEHRANFSPRTLQEEGYIYVNKWRVPDWYVTEADIQPFYRFMCRLFPDKTEREYMYEWVAMLVWHPEKKSWCPVLKGEQGTGKSSFLSMLALLVGRNNTHITANHKTVSGEFNAIWMESVLVGLEEVKNIPNAPAFYNTLKTYITDIGQSGACKQKDIERYNCFSKVIVCTNADIPFPIEEDDRRLAVFNVPHRKSQEETREFMKEFIPWMQDNIGAIACWLKSKVVTDWSRNAPHTEAKTQMIYDSIPAWELALEEYLEGKEVVMDSQTLLIAQENVRGIKKQTVNRWLKDRGWLQKRIRDDRLGQIGVFVSPEKPKLIEDTKIIKEKLHEHH
jgi:hypothetical protein